MISVVVKLQHSTVIEQDQDEAAAPHGKQWEAGAFIEVVCEQKNF